jgi:exoribonuclease R
MNFIRFFVSNTNNFFHIPRKMEKGVIEIHGGKTVVHLEDDKIVEVSQGQHKDFLPKDQVFYNRNSGVLILLHRKPQQTLGVVNEKGIVQFPLFGPTCGFIYNPITKIYQPNTRLLINLDEKGNVNIVKEYTTTTNDLEIILELYRTFPNLNPFYSAKGEPLYTIPDIINHNDLNTFTIDPAHSVDFDDAITVIPEEKTIYIHIVDIANVPLQTEEEKRLRYGVTSLYLANEHTEHLLDTETASFTLSLIKGEERNVITTKVVLNDEGQVVHYDIYRSTIIVKNRFNYEEVQTLIDSGSAPEDIMYLVNLTKQRNHHIKYNINLPSLTLDIKDGNLQNVKQASTADNSHTLIATTMVLCNMVVSIHLRKKGINLPNRFHDTLHGVFVPKFKSTGEEHVDSFIIIKRFARAYYSIDKYGHFGLGLKDYVHFTSPMRRYADVLAHKLLAGVQIPKEVLEQEVEHINYRSNLCRSLQSLYSDWKIGRYIESKKQEELDVWITDVKPAGVIWFCPTYNVNGFCHVSQILPKQKYTYQPDTLQGNNGAVLEVGKQVKGVVKGVQKVYYNVDLQIKI